MNRITELELLLDEWNSVYRFEGRSIVPDSVYDKHMDELAELDPDNKRLTKVGETPPNDERKENLPMIMASMNKVKSFEELKAWMLKKSIPLNTILCITPKYDALSGLYDVKNEKGWTRGDGVIGQNSEPHFKDILEKYPKDKLESFLQAYKHAPFVYTTGEVIIPKETFLKKHSKIALGEDGFDNGRNRVGGLFNKYKKENKQHLNDIVYMRYGLHCGVDLDKSKQLDILNDYFNNPEVPYKLHTIDELSTEYLADLFKEWSKTFEIDGLIIEVNDAKLRNSIKPEKSTKDNPEVMNPSYARAYKAGFEEVKETTVLNLKLEISKLGFLIPVAEVEPTMLDGAEVTNVTCNNAKMVYDFGIGQGAILKICRSGMVIPYIIDVVKKSEEYFLFPTNCPCCNTTLIWNDTNTHLMCTNENCTERKIKQITSFFDILDVKGVRETTFRQLYNSGYDTIQKILAMSIDDLKTIDRMGETKASNTYDSIHSKIDDITLSKLQHASGFFSDQNTGFSLGSKKLLLLEHFTQKPSVSDVKEIDGFSDSSALLYCSNYDRFFEWAKTLSVSIKKEKETIITSDNCIGKTFIFTGIRRKDLEEIIKQQGGKVVDSISRNCTHLIMKTIGSGSNKEKKALEYNMIIWTVEQLENFLNK
jgi:NAD-dependent DNA ligase